VRSSVIAALLGGCVLSALPARAAPGIAVRLVDTWATRGEPLRVEAIVDDPVGVVDRIAFELARDGEWVATATATGAPWTATFVADVIWPHAPQRLELRARALGRRGGVLLDVGRPFPLELDILDPVAAAERRRDLTAASSEEEPFPVTVGVALEGRVGSAARTRVHLAVLGPVSSAVELKLGLSVGPSFAEPAALDGGGPLVFGAELGARLSADPRWFADLVATADARFPGFDPGGALFVGARGPWGPVGWEVSAGGGALAAGVDDTPEAVFFGALRVGVRFGSTSEGPSAKTVP
jgi:hypothetical protein